jgi:hypothetical protein
MHTFTIVHDRPVHVFSNTFLLMPLLILVDAITELPSVPKTKIQAEAYRFLLLHRQGLWVAAV